MMRRKIYGLMMVGMMLLMAGCSTDDVVKETTSAEGIAISFSCNYDNEEENETGAGQQGAMGLTGAGQQVTMGAANQGMMGTTRAGHQGVMNTEDLYATGFGVMASLTADKKPNMMYNQEVEFTFVGDMDPADPSKPTELMKGYWSYQPVKYWPTDLEHCYISAYAPYVETADLEEDATGIYGLSTNSTAPYVDYRRCEKPGNVVDLLWYYKDFVNESGDTEDIPDAGILNMKMRHALARLEINVALDSNTVLASGTKVLIEQITLQGRMAKTGRLSLCNQDTVGSGNNIKYYPIWTNQTYDKDEGGTDSDRTFYINNEDNDSESYGIIDAQVRYIPGMPHTWQPEGLKVYNSKATDDGLRNALSTGDRTGYVYLIPQSGLQLTVSVKYRKWAQGEALPAAETKSSTINVTKTNPLRGNTTYKLNLKLSGI